MPDTSKAGKLEEMQKRFSTDHFATALGIVIESVGPGAVAVCSALPKKMYLNSVGTVQGGFLFTLADFAFAVAANSEYPGTVTLNAGIHFVSAAGKERLTATAAPKSLGKKIKVYEVSVRGEDGREVALCTVTGYTKPPKAKYSQTT